MAKFEKGKSGNPNGRPPAKKELREKLEKHIDAAIAALVGALTDEDGRVVVSAAKEIIHQFYGAPAASAPEQIPPEGEGPPVPPVYAELKRTDPTPAEFPDAGVH